MQFYISIKTNNNTYLTTNLLQTLALSTAGLLYALSLNQQTDIDKKTFTLLMRLLDPLDREHLRTSTTGLVVLILRLKYILCFYFNQGCQKT